MQAARLYGPRDMRIETLPDPPPPAAEEVQMRVTAVGVCGSDLHTWAHGEIGDTKLQGPLILGHEFAGVIEAVGAEVTHLAVGQRVAVEPAQSCGQCEYCQIGHPHLCLRLHFCGLWPDDGALCERMNFPAEGCFPIPDSISDSDAAMLEVLGIAIHAVDLGKVRPARSVAVLGCGPIGLAIIQMAQVAGASPIYATDRLPHRLEAAKRYGADETFNVDHVNATEEILQRSDGLGVHVAFEAAWADATVEQAATITRPAGRVVLVGIPAEDKLLMRASIPRRKGLTVLFSRRMKFTYPRAIELAKRGDVDLTSLVSHRFPLEETAQAFNLAETYGDGVLKAVVEMSRS